MMNAIRRISIGGAALAITLFAAAASAQQKPETPFDRFIAHFDLGVSADGFITTTTTGTTYLPQTVALNPSKTVGALASLRYTKSSLIGLEFNYGFVRYSDNYTVSNTSATPAGNLPFALTVQAKVNEYSVAYIAHTPGSFYNVKPFAGVGVGGLYFQPTAGGGLGLPKQPRVAYFYEVGADAPLLGPNFGARVQLRQEFFGSPDYNQNYFATGKRSITTQPTIGFYYRF